MDWYVYIIQSNSSRKYYYGSTNNLFRRIAEHNRGHTTSTRNRGPWAVIYSEKFETKSEARQKERLLKSYKGGNALKKLLIETRATPPLAG